MVIGLYWTVWIIWKQCITLFTRVYKWRNKTYHILLTHLARMTDLCCFGWGNLYRWQLACRLAAPTWYLSKCWLVINYTFQNKLQWNQNWNNHIFIYKNSIENVGQFVSTLVSGMAKAPSDVRVNSDWEIFSIYYLYITYLQYFNIKWNQQQK